MVLTEREVKDEQPKHSASRSFPYMMCKYVWTKNNLWKCMNTSHSRFFLLSTIYSFPFPHFSFLSPLSLVSLSLPFFQCSVHQTMCHLVSKRETIDLCCSTASWVKELKLVLKRNAEKKMRYDCDDHSNNILFSLFPPFR